MRLHDNPVRGRVVTSTRTCLPNKSNQPSTVTALVNNNNNNTPRCGPGGHVGPVSALPGPGSEEKHTFTDTHLVPYESDPASFLTLAGLAS
ncbi:hypothetical protein EYF80_045094 [Liparis tanakae]|uniref:Uncharacterized protein n=1 Tax=Liparis tanakae TaxID=230148 RepID=A0A4Z2FWJ4_9TELE|nr:hypothetical protein EYF80_045094 [Liparis tanakae]